MGREPERGKLAAWAGAAAIRGSHLAAMLDRPPVADPDRPLLDAYSLAVTGVAEAVGPAVCAVNVGARGQGSGVVLSPDGLIVTNSHVVKDMKSVELALPDARRIGGRVLGS